ncbi:hypothetical protein PFISCL1PPCAC_23292, partial [Pristionchus fissidentatus]
STGLLLPREMRFILLLLLGISSINCVDEDQRAYLAFKTVSPKLTRRVTALQDKACNYTTMIPGEISPRLHKSKLASFWKSSLPTFNVYFGTYGNVSEFFSDANAFELHLIDFNYDAAEHKSQIAGLLARSVRFLCKTYPRAIPFDNFTAYSTTSATGGVGIKGRFQNIESLLYDKLSELFTGSGIVVFDSLTDQNNFGFVAIRKTTLLGEGLSKFFPNLKPLGAQLKKQPLLSSAFVDTLYMCVEDANHQCEILGSIKIERC